MTENYSAVQFAITCCGSVLCRFNENQKNCFFTLNMIGQKIISPKCDITVTDSNSLVAKKKKKQLEENS